VSRALLGARLARLPCADPPPRGSPRALLEELWAKTGCGAPSPAVSCPPWPAAAPQSPVRLPPAVGDAAGATVSPAPRRPPGRAQLRAPRCCSGVGSHPTSFGRELVRDSVLPSLCKAFGVTALLPAGGRDAWRASSVEGFPRDRVLMRNSLVGQQYRLTHSLKKLLFKGPRCQLQVFQRPGGSQRSAVASERSRRKSGETGEQGMSSHALIRRCLRSLRRAKQQPGRKPTPCLHAQKPWPGVATPQPASALGRAGRTNET